MLYNRSIAKRSCFFVHRATETQRTLHDTIPDKNIAVLTPSRPFRLNRHVKPICIADNFPSDNSGYRSASIAGFGNTRKNCYLLISFMHLLWYSLLWWVLIRDCVEFMKLMLIWHRTRQTIEQTACGLYSICASGSMYSEQISQRCYERIRDMCLLSTRWSLSGEFIEIEKIICSWWWSICYMECYIMC